MVSRGFKNGGNVQANQLVQVVFLRRFKVYSSRLGGVEGKVPNEKSDIHSPSPLVGNCCSSSGHKRELCCSQAVDTNDCSQLVFFEPHLSMNGSSFPSRKLQKKRLKTMKRSRHFRIPGSLQQSVQPWSRTKDLHILATQCLLWLTPADWLQWLGRFANRMHDARYTVIIHVCTPVYHPIVCVCYICLHYI